MNDSERKYSPILAAVLAGFIVFLVAATVKGQTAPTPDDVNAIQDEVAARKKKIEDLNRQIEIYNQQLAERRKETASIRSSLGILENRIAKTELDIEAATEEIAATELFIESLTAAVAEKERTIQGHKGIMGEYVRVIGERTDASDLEILLAHDNLSDYFNALNSIEQLNAALLKRTQDLKAAKAALLGQQRTQEEKKIELAAFQKKLEDARAELSEKIGAKETLYVASQETEAAIRRDLAKLRAEQQQIDSEIISLENSLRRKLSANKRFQELGDGVLSWPVPLLAITTYFHDTDYPFRYVFEHPGLDLRAGQGSPVRSASSGYIARAKDGGSRGYSFVMVIHANGLSTVYGHVSQILVKEDDFVERGQVIALSGGLPGTTGAGRLTTGPHLHFEVRLNGIPVNPLEYLPR